MKKWHVYILRCADNTLYTGVTTDIERRLREHNGELTRGAMYTKFHRPVTLVYRESAASRSAALKREWVIKKMSKQEKENLTRDARYATIEPC